jgi:hypothetical protein
MAQQPVAAVDLVELKQIRMPTMPLTRLQDGLEAPQPLLDARVVDLSEGRYTGPHLRIEVVISASPRTEKGSDPLTI